MKMFNDDEPTPYDALLMNIEHIEQISGIVADLSGQLRFQQAEIAKLRADIYKLSQFNHQLTKSIKELTEYVTAKKS
jgi:hypothetical protein